LYWFIRVGITLWITEGLLSGRSVIAAGVPSIGTVGVIGHRYPLTPVLYTGASLRRTRWRRECRPTRYSPSRRKTDRRIGFVSTEEIDEDRCQLHLLPDHCWSGALLQAFGGREHYRHNGHLSGQ